MQGTQEYKGKSRINILEEIQNKINRVDELNNLEKKIYSTFNSESSAIMNEMLLGGSEHFTKKLVNSDISIVERILNKIDDLKTMFERVADAKAKTEYKKLIRAEKMYLNAITEAGYRYNLGKIIQNIKDKKEQEENKKIATQDIDSEIKEETSIQFNKKIVKYIPYAKIGMSNISHIRTELYKIYSGINEGVADGIAIENHSAIYVVDSGKENGDLRFGVRRIIKISDGNLRKERMVKINDRAIQNGFISEQLLGKIKSSSGDNSRSSVGRQLQEELSNNTRESTNNEERIFGENGNRGIRILKDSKNKNIDSEDTIKYSLMNNKSFEENVDDIINMSDSEIIKK